MKYKLSELIDIIVGGTPNTSRLDYWNGNIPWLSVKDFNNDFRYVYTTEKRITKEGLENSSTKLLNKGDVIISARGTVGEVASIPYPMAFNQSCYGLRPRAGLIISDYLYYLIKYNVSFFKKKAHGSVFDTITRETFENIEVDIPALDEQERISSVLSDLDAMIELKIEINKNLEEQVLALYRNKFINIKNYKRHTCRAEEYFDISIGKTPPRKEHQWFSTNYKDITWISISDMRNSGLYIGASAEYLTKEAIKRHNIKIVPDNTILLSFKLTIGRIAITNGEMATNEAIAHFKTDQKSINEYLYCYLKYFNYETMGSTSSIATAVNSKIIKNMPFVVPTDKELKEFHNIARPMFSKIKANQEEITSLILLRDSLLPKLLSGEIDISNIKV